MGARVRKRDGTCVEHSSWRGRSLFLATALLQPPTCACLLATRRQSLIRGHPANAFLPKAVISSLELPISQEARRLFGDLCGEQHCGMGRRQHDVIF